MNEIKSFVPFILHSDFKFIQQSAKYVKILSEWSLNSYSQYLLFFVYIHTGEFEFESLEDYWYLKK